MNRIPEMAAGIQRTAGIPGKAEGIRSAGVLMSQRTAVAAVVKVEVAADRCRHASGRTVCSQPP